MDYKGVITAIGLLVLITGCLPPPDCNNNTIPAPPLNLFPADGARDISLTPGLEASPFSDPDGDIHQASEWEIRIEGSDYSSSVFKRVNHETRITVPEGILQPSTRYYWRVRYQDDCNNWSEYSEETSFITIEGKGSVEITIE